MERNFKKKEKKDNGENTERKTEQSGTVWK